MPQEALVELVVEDGRPYASSRRVGDPLPGGTRYVFRMLTRDVEFPPFQVVQHWISKGDLYPLRGTPAPMFLPVLEAYWSICRKHGTIFHDEVQDTYLLARLLPHIRSNAARGVVLDSVPTPAAGRSVRMNTADALDQLLRKHIERHDIARFHIATADAIGPAEETPEAQERNEALYDEMEHELLGHGRAVMQKHGEEAGDEAMRSTWARWQRSFGRRSGHRERKRIAAVLSYEAKAAFHRAYSAVWHELLNQHAIAAWGMSEAAERFHRFWHCELLVPSDEFPNLRSSVFHGHVPSLHPATALFAMTPTGRSLIGAWLAAPTQAAPRERFLGGLTVAVYHYALGLNETQEQRRGRSVRGLDLDEVAAVDPSSDEGVEQPDTAADED